MAASPEAFTSAAAQLEKVLESIFADGQILPGREGELEEAVQEFMGCGGIAHHFGHLFGEAGGRLMPESSKTETPEYVQDLAVVPWIYLRHYLDGECGNYDPDVPSGGAKGAFPTSNIGSKMHGAETNRPLGHSLVGSRRQ